MGPYKSGDPKGPPALRRSEKEGREAPRTSRIQNFVRDQIYTQKTLELSNQSISYDDARFIASMHKISINELYWLMTIATVVNRAILVQMFSEGYFH